MANHKKSSKKTAIIIAWRKGEDDLDATIDSASRSIPGATIIAVEDKDASGPARTRHKGIIADIKTTNIILIDAHMRFQGSVLADMAAHLSAQGGLIVPYCYGLEGETIRMDQQYCGARMVYRAQDGSERTALAAKWSKDRKPGVRGAVMGACYGFRREWYMSAGQPLAALPGWGGDEEILSIAAWISGEAVELVDGMVGHRFRNSPPWKRDARQIAAEQQAKLASRMTLIHCVADDASRRELFDWQGNGANNHNLTAYSTPESERCRKALRGFVRNFADWKRDICEPDEINGVQTRGVSILQPVYAKAIEKLNTNVSKPIKSVGKSNYGATESRRVCHACQSPNSRIVTVRRAGSLVIRYRICDDCKARRTTQEIVSA